MAQVQFLCPQGSRGLPTVARGGIEIDGGVSVLPKVPGTRHRRALATRSRLSCLSHIPSCSLLWLSVHEHPNFARP